MMWLGSGCSAGKAKEAARPVGCVRARQGAEPASYRCGESHERQATRGTGDTNRAKGRRGRKVET